MAGTSHAGHYKAKGFLVSRLTSEVWPAPVGMDLTSEPMLLSALWQKVQNFLCDQQGKARGQGRMTQLALGSIGAKVDGVGYLDTSGIYYQYNTAFLSGFLVWSFGGTVYTSAMSTLAIPPTFSAKVSAITGSGLVSGNRMRMVPFGVEMIMVQDGATNDYYINPNTGLGGTLGIPDPSTPPTVVAGAGVLAAGDYQYAYTYVDYLNRESDLSGPTAYTSSGADGPSITVPGLTAGTDKFSKGDVYRTKAGTTSPFFFLNQVTAASPTIFDDATTDATLSGRPQAPHPGENAPPLAGNQLCVWRNRVWMNVSGQPYLIQCSNTGSASQWSALSLIGTFPNTDGEVIRVQSSSSDFVVGFAPLSSILLVFKRYSIYSVLGYDISNFTAAELKPAGRGCVAPDTIRVCDDLAIFLGTDGVYGIDPGGNLIKLSKQVGNGNGGIEADIVALYTTVQGRINMQNAVAWYVDRTYYLTIGTITYAYNLDTTAWTEDVYANFGTAVVNIANVMLANSIPALALVGLDSSPFGVYCLDNYNTGQNITNLQLVTRCLADRSSTKTVRKLRIYGTASAIASGTLTCFFDNYSEAYTLNVAQLTIPVEAARGVLIYQEFTAYAQGREVYFTLSLSGTGVILTNWEVETMAQS